MAADNEAYAVIGAVHIRQRNSGVVGSFDEFVHCFIVADADTGRVSLEHHIRAALAKHVQLNCSLSSSSPVLGCWPVGGKNLCMWFVW